MTNSHLKTLKYNESKIIHEGTPLDEFESNFMREPSYNWNPPICSTLMAIGKNDIDDQYDYNDFDDLITDNNDSFVEDDNATGRLTVDQWMEFHPESGASASGLYAEANQSTNNSALPEAVFSPGSVIPQNLLIPKQISKITELTLDQFKNNYRLLSKK